MKCNINFSNDGNTLKIKGVDTLLPSSTTYLVFDGDKLLVYLERLEEDSRCSDYSMYKEIFNQLLKLEDKVFDVLERGVLVCRKD